jgi:hypothetical protein
VLEVTEYFIHQLDEADWLTRACNSTRAEAFKTQPPSFVLVTLRAAGVKDMTHFTNISQFCYRMMCNDSDVLQ